MGRAQWICSMALVLALQQHLPAALQAPAGGAGGTLRRGSAGRFADLSINVSDDGEIATIQFAFDGQVNLYRLERFSVFVPGAQLLRHTENGVAAMIASIPSTFRSRTHGRRASVTQRLDGTISGVFEFNGSFYHLDPLDLGVEALNFAATAKGVEKQYTYFKTHRMHVLEMPYIASKILPASSNNSRPFKLHPNRVSSADDSLPEVRGELDETGNLPDEPHAPRVPIVIIDYQVPELEVHARSAQQVGNFSGEEWFPGCYEGDSNMHTMVIGLIGDVQMYKEYSSNAATMMIESVTTASMVYEGQMHIELVIGHMKVYESAQDAPTFANGCAATGDYAHNDDIRAIMASLRQDYKSMDDIPFEASLTLFTGCGPSIGTVGLAYLDQLCNPWGYGVSVVKVREEPHTASAWLTFAHELGHTLGAIHSFEDGQGSTGGIMDYADGKLNGVYQFHEYRKAEMCATLSKGLEHCDGKFWQKGVEYAPPIEDDMCEDFPNYKDRVGDECLMYDYYLWCNATGGYGPGWNPNWGDFQSYAKDGVRADQACCACGGGTWAPTATPTKAPSASPTVAATTKGPVSAFGDPHLKNTRGETFKVERPGNHTLLVVPAGAGQDTAMLRMQGVVTYRGAVCGPLYITTLVVTGTGLGNLKRLTFTTRTEEFNTPITRSLSVGNSEISAEDFAAEAVGSDVIKQVSFYEPEKPTTVNNHVTTFMVLLDVSVGRVKVRWEHQKEVHGYSNWLWLDITGLDIAQRIGGLLGDDDHRFIATPPQQCQAAQH